MARIAFSIVICLVVIMVIMVIIQIVSASRFKALAADLMAQVPMRRRLLPFLKAQPPQLFDLPSVGC